MTFGNYVGYPPRVNGDLVWTGTGGLSDTQTFRWIILNAIHDTLAATSLFSGFVCKRIVNALPIEAFSQVPFLGVYSPRMELGPDGDFNASDIRFSHHVPIGIQVIVKNNDPVAMMKKLDECEQFIMLSRMAQSDVTTAQNIYIQGADNILRNWERVGQRARGLQVRAEFLARGGLQNVPVGFQFPQPSPEEEARANARLPAAKAYREESEKTATACCMCMERVKSRFPSAGILVTMDRSFTQLVLLEQ